MRMKAGIVAETIFVVIGFGLSTYQDAAERGWDLSYPLILGFQGNVWYPFLGVFLLPMGIGAFFILMKKI